MQDDKNNATVVRFEALPDCLFRIWIKPDWASTSLHWEAGQFLSLGIMEDPATDRKKVRPMTIIDVENGIFEFYMVAVSDGTTSPRIAQLRSGQRCFMDPRISGNFKLQNVPQWENADLWMIGSGTGIAPYLAMLRHDEAQLKKYRNLIFIHSVRQKNHLCYQSEIQAYSKKYKSFHYIPVVTRSEEDLGEGILQKRIHLLFESGVIRAHTNLSISSQESVFMLCGNPHMIKNVLTILPTLLSYLRETFP